MGFLRKEWDWENPAYHEMENQETEQQDRKLWLWGLTSLCGGLSCFLLYHIYLTLHHNNPYYNTPDNQGKQKNFVFFLTFYTFLL